MSSSRTILKRHPMWAVFLAIALPLSALLLLQYSWLDDLRQTSASAHRSDRHDYIEKVATEIKYFYWSSAERTLNLPSAVFTQNRPDLASQQFRKSTAEGVTELFTVRLADWTVLFFNPHTGEMEPRTGYPPEVRAAFHACTPLKTAFEKRTVLYKVELSVDETDPDQRVILNPVVDESSRVVGAAGMILDNEYFLRSVMPSHIERSISPFLADYAVVTVRDDKGEIVYSTTKPMSRFSEVEINLPFVFQDWRLGLHSRQATPEQLARRGYAFNLALLVVIWLLFLGGLALALITASREIKLSQMKSDFVSNVSHELRTPLASIRLFGEMMRLGKVSGEQKVREYGEYIETESRRLSQLLNNILDFAKIESARKTYDSRAEDLQDVLESVLKTFGVRLQHLGFEIDVQFPEPRLPPVTIDRQAIAQAINNILDNAVKYSGESRRLEIALRREGDQAAISVRDFGIGISRGEQPRIFDRFHRVSTGLVHDVRGSGLGLSIVKHVVAAHGGRVGVESDPGRGSTFTIWLPLSPGRHGTPAPQAAAWGGGDEAAPPRVSAAAERVQREQR